MLVPAQPRSSAHLAHLLDDLLLDLGGELLLRPALPHRVQRIAGAAAELLARLGIGDPYGA